MHPTECQNTWVRKRTAMRNRCIHYCSQRLQHSSIRNGQIQQMENEQGIAELNTIKWLDIIDTDRLLLPLQWQKVWRGTKEPLDEDEGGEWKSWLKTKLKKKRKN